MYAKLNNGVIEKYPYTIGELRRDNPQTSFPSSISQSLLDEYGLVHVVVVSKPQADHTKNVVEQNPVFDGSQWNQSWVVQDATAEEIQQRTDAKKSSVRAERTVLLGQSDWTQLEDSQVDKTAWAAYRQALRDIPSQAGFPWEVVWPTKPE